MYPIPELEGRTTKNVSFGVGCLQFVPKTRGPYDFSIAKYASDLRQSLESIDSISEIYISDDLKTGDDTVYFLDNMPRFEDGERPIITGFAPFLQIQFKIYIPQRVQKQLIKDILAERVSEVEEFHVYISNQYYCPVATIICICDEIFAEASKSMVIVREFLQKSMAENEKCPLVIDTLGPTPFHSEFHLMWAEIRCESKKRYGIKRELSG